ncbi:MAG: hypothetical protein J6M05_01780 [Cardiobacteriaceae bacterium]|nr:hypothetical protein [Cardiobacteriaceae bacterium]
MKGYYFEVKRVFCTKQIRCFFFTRRIFYFSPSMHALFRHFEAVRRKISLQITVILSRKRKISQ